MNELEKKLSRLKICIFCGNYHKEEFTFKKEQSPVLPEHFYHQVVCSCGANGPYGDTIEEAIYRWNRRLM